MNVTRVGNRQSISNMSKSLSAFLKEERENRPNYVATFLKAAREKKRVSREQLAKKIKRYSVAKTLKLITEFEETGRSRSPEPPLRSPGRHGWLR